MATRSRTELALAPAVDELLDRRGGNRSLPLLVDLGAVITRRTTDRSRLHGAWFRAGVVTVPSAPRLAACSRPSATRAPRSTVGPVPAADLDTQRGRRHRGERNRPLELPDRGQTWASSPLVSLISTGRSRDHPSPSLRRRQPRSSDRSIAHTRGASTCSLVNLFRTGDYRPYARSFDSS